MINHSNSFSSMISYDKYSNLMFIGSPLHDFYFKFILFCRELPKALLKKLPEGGIKVDHLFSLMVDPHEEFAIIHQMSILWLR